MSRDQKPLSKIKSGVLSRGFSLAKLSLSVGAKAATHAVGGIFASEESKPERLKQLLMSQMERLSQELGELKGSLMKVGQMLSMYGEHFLPPEANAFLKTLQSQSPPLAWAAIERVLLKELGAEKLALLEINREPLASASLGQVHRARVLATGAKLALKVQYPGVEKAIEGDLKALRSLFATAKLIPRGPKLDTLFDEVKTMLRQETDYIQERLMTDKFKVAMATDARFVVPATFAEFSSPHVLATSFEEGVPVDCPSVAALSQDRRNALGKAALDLYMREIFEFGKVQTDPHFGNYRARLGVGDAPDQLVLFDFGAVRSLDARFLVPYREMVLAALTRDAARVERSGLAMGFLRPEDSLEMRRAYSELVFLITEPFFDSGEEPYDWAESDLPRRVAALGAKFGFTSGFRAPPPEIVFLDRKLGGMFVLLSKLRVRLPGKLLAEVAFQRL